MLVLTRKKSETIHIGEGIVVKVVQTGRGSIKIGIEAPAHVRVLRGEVAEAVLSELPPRSTDSTNVVASLPTPETERTALGDGPRSMRPRPSVRSTPPFAHVLRRTDPSVVGAV